MDVTPLIPIGRQIIQSYGDGGFRISGARHVGSVLIFPAQTVSWPVALPEDMTLDSLAAIALAEPKVEFLVLGTGPQLRGLSPALRRHFRELGIAIDVMDTGAACRTYNVLLAEERRVAAALIAV